MKVTVRGVDRSARYTPEELAAIEVVLAADQGEVGLGHAPVIDDTGVQEPNAGEQFLLEVGAVTIVDGLAGAVTRDRNGAVAGTRLVQHHTIADDNAFLDGHRAIKWKRPRETDRARILAFINDFLGHLSLDTTWVLNTHTEMLPAKTYTTEALYSELQEDCGKPTGKTMFIEQRRFHWHLPTEGYISDLAIVEAEDADWIDSFPLMSANPPSRSKDPSTLANDVVAINSKGQRRSATDATSITRHDSAGARHQVLVEEGDATPTELQTIANTTKNERRNERVTYEGEIGPLTAEQVARIPVGCLINVTNSVWGLSSSTQRIATMTIKYLHPDLFMVALELAYPIFKRSKPPITTPPIGHDIDGSVLPPFVCTPTDFTVPHCDDANDTSALTAVSTGISDYSPKGVLLYAGATYRIDWTITHATTTYELNIDYLLATNPGGGFNFPVNNAGHDPAIGGSEDPASYPMVSSSTQIAVAGADECYYAYITEGSGYAGYNIIGSSVTAVVTYISGPDPRFEGLGMCQEGGEPSPGQPVIEQIVSDGTTTVLGTNHPYIAGSIIVDAQGPRVIPDETDPEAGAFTLPAPLPAGTIISLAYKAADSTFLPASFADANQYLLTSSAQLVPYTLLGTGGNGSGDYRLGDDGVWHSTSPTEDAIDRAIGKMTTFPNSALGSGTVIQDAVHTVGTAPATGPFTSVTTTFATDGGTGLPTAGNTLMAVCMVNKQGASAANATPAGWTKRSIATVVPGSQFEVSLFTKVSDGTEASVTVLPGAATSFTWATLYIAEIGGSFGGYVEDATGTNITSRALPAITPTAGADALIMAIAGATNAYAMSSGPSGYGSAILDDSNANTGSSGRLNVWSRHENPASGSSYGGTVAYSGGSVTFEWVSQVWFSATLADAATFAVTDEDDTTYQAITAGPTDLLTIDLGGSYLINRSRLRVSSAAAGSRTYEIYGATASDFSDEVLLDSITYVATGSYTPEDLELSWSPTVARRYYRLVGTSEARRIYTWSLYSPAIGAAIDAVIDAHLDDPADAHDASAISFTPASGIAATDVQAAIVEDAGDLAAHIAVGGVPSSPIVMRYTFDTTTTDSDPGSGKLRLSNATQYLAVTIRADLTDADGVDVTALLDVIATAGSGYVRLQKRDDPTKWLVATLSASASPSGYRNLTISNIAKSATSPFANGDALLMSFIPTGGGGGAALTVEEVDGSPTDSAITKIVFPNGTLGIASHIATYTPAAGAGGATAFIGCSVSGTSTALSTAAYTSLAFGAADTYDTDGFHDPASNNTRLTVPAGMGGKYLLTAMLAIPVSTPATDHRLAYRVTGGTDILMSRHYYNDGGSSVFLHESVVIDLAAGDYVEVRGYTDLASTTATQYRAQLTKLDSGKVGQGIGCHAYNSGYQVLGAAGVLTFDSEFFDTDGFHSLSSNTGRVTVPAGLGGKYIVVGFAYNGTSASRDIFLKKNGNYLAYQHMPAVTARITELVDLVPGDYIELYVGASGTYGHTSAEAQNSLSLMRLDSGSPGAGVGGLLGAKSSTATPTQTSSTPGVVDAALDITFDAPASGKVLCTMSALMDFTSGFNFYWCILEGATNLGETMVWSAGSSAHHFYNTARVLITGLAPGSHTLRWAQRTNGGGTMQVAGGSQTPVVFSIEAVPS